MSGEQNLPIFDSLDLHDEVETTEHVLKALISLVGKAKLTIFGSHGEGLGAILLAGVIITLAVYAPHTIEAWFSIYPEGR